MPRRNQPVVDGARGALNQLKYEVAHRTGPLPERVQNEAQFQSYMDRFKHQVADELGIDLRRGYNGHLTSREAGKIGGHLGGHIGGHMVRQMIRQAEAQLAQRTPR